MNHKLIFSALVGALAIQCAAAGTSWCPKEPVSSAKCALDGCPDIGARISAGYDTDYVWKGVRWARDSAWFDVNQTFENLPLSPTIGVWHLSSLGSGQAANDNYGDETNLYASVKFWEMWGFQSFMKYTHRFYPSGRGPNGPVDDSFGYVTTGISRELFCGVTLTYTRDWNFGRSVSSFADSAIPYPFGQQEISGFFHTLEMCKTFCLNDCVDLILTGGVSYNDNFFNSYEFNSIGSHSSLHNPGALTRGRDSGWHNYYLKAALPIALNCRATLIPYVQYNGTPDTWTADNMWGGTINPGANRNDVLYGGIRLSVTF